MRVEQYATVMTRHVCSVAHRFSGHARAAPSLRSFRSHSELEFKQVPRHARVLAAAQASSTPEEMLVVCPAV